eukprot:1663374-Ditylum_brightwellii.AAC.1
MGNDKMGNAENETMVKTRRNSSYGNALATASHSISPSKKENQEKKKVEKLLMEKHQGSSL